MDHLLPADFESGAGGNGSGRRQAHPSHRRERLFSHKVTGGEKRDGIVWTKGKKSPILKAVDREAKMAGKNPRTQDFGFRSGKVARSKVSGGSSSMYEAHGQEATIRVYRSMLIGKTDHKIIFDLFSDEAGLFAKKCFAYAALSIAAELHRQHCYRVKFNDDPRHPQIEDLLQEVPCSG
jgi:hypothetical protein